MLILYSEHGKKFCPTFCIAKAKVNDPEGAFFLRHLGTDRLDLLQTGIRLTGTTEVANILANHPEWDKGPRRLRLPALNQDGVRVGEANHINQASWKGNLAVRDVTLLTCWNRGRALVEELDSNYASRLASLDAKPGTTIRQGHHEPVRSSPASAGDSDTRY